MKVTLEKLVALTERHTTCFEEMQASILVLTTREPEMMKDQRILGDGSSITKVHPKGPATASKEWEDTRLVNDRRKATMVTPTTTRDEEYREGMPRLTTDELKDSGVVAGVTTDIRSD